MQKAKICMLTSVHTPFDNRIFHKECKTLTKAGYKVTFLVPHDRDEAIDGVSIRRVPKPKGRMERMTRMVWQVYQAALAENAQAYHFHDPELITVGLLLKLHRKKVIYDVHEDVPLQVLNKYWIPQRLRRPVAKAIGIVEILGMNSFDGIVVANPPKARKCPARKTVLVQNFPVLDELAFSEKCPHAERPPLIVYVGGISGIRGARAMVKAMSLLPSACGARLALAGIFSPPELELEIQQMPGWERVEFLGWKSRIEVARLLTRSRIGLALLRPAPNYLEAYPTKLFEYMSAGIPVIASDFPLWRKIIEEAGCGFLVDPLDAEAIARAIGWLLEHPKEAEAMGKRGQEAVLARYNWDIEAQKLLEFYKGVIES